MKLLVTPCTSVWSSSLLLSPDFVAPSGLEGVELIRQ
jgi:hypothetical protein